MTDSPEELVVPSGSFDDREMLSQNEKSSFKPLEVVNIPGLGKYEIGVPGKFNGDTFQLVARDEDGKDIPLVSYGVTENNESRTFTPTINESAQNYFGDRVDMDKIMDRFASELDSWLTTQLKENK